MAHAWDVVLYPRVHKRQSKYINSERWEPHENRKHSVVLKGAEWESHAPVAGEKQEPRAAVFGHHPCLTQL